MTCEEFRFAAMALADGEIPSIPELSIGTHLAACEACRREVELWPRVQGRLRPPERYWLSLLVVFKLADFVPDGSIGVWDRLVGKR